MNKAWITGLTIAGVAGSAGAAFAGVSSNSPAGTAVEAQGLSAEATTTEAAPHTATYQVGAAGTVTVTAADGALTVDSALPGAFWTLVGYSTPAAHVEVQFSDAAQEVTFVADLVNGEIVVSLTNVPAPGATTTSIEITQITDALRNVTPAPQPAVVAPKSVYVPVATPGSHTTSPSSAGEHEDDHYEDDHYEDHEYEDGGSDD